ncbi:hypothetical protein SUGI_1187430 [Cryptomeria japonica]|uniref:AAA-ATPase ASD, mitochondrial n=1 Tax=Cryptomeria japonica TaxID=3369 RepID=UPI002414A7F7|nr:AAA-ATPase ASD, mitochondrial [Cryptomeria japonica]GLJ55340.1 hypothetical protein SUGI_1187430 [Cryptomeria japonica]
MEMDKWSNLGKVAATTVFVGTIVGQYLPPELYEYFREQRRRLSRFLSPYITLVIEEISGFKVSDLYESVQIYLSTRSISTATRLKVSKAKKDKAFTFAMDTSQQIMDEFHGVKVWWTLRTEVKPPSLLNVFHDKCYLELTFHKKDKATIFESYLPHVIAEAKIMQLKKRQRKIYTNICANSQSHPSARNPGWNAVVFEHPATFETLALDPELKDDIIQDLTNFSQREKYYKDVGRAWKRGYLLYGPPGTGKSSMIAAISNFLEYDIYDLELTEVKSNTELRTLLIGTTNKSVIVIEDIDCSLDLSGRRKKAKKESREMQIPGTDQSSSDNSKVTLSGVLNFTDGLWSCCGSERVIIFTTNHVDRLDPALLRSGRMDKHIHLSFCSFPAFKILARNYLGVEDHPLFEEIEVLMKEVEISPADVSEELMRVSNNPTAALEKLIEALRQAVEKAAVKNEILVENESAEDNLVAEESPHGEE